MEIKTYKICPSCNYFCNVNEKDQFCSLCGEKLIEKCKNCGDEISNPYAQYCKYCGSPYRILVEKASRIIHKRI